MSEITECDVCGKRDYSCNYSRSAGVSEIINDGLKPKKRFLTVGFLVQEHGEGIDEDVDICPVCRVSIVKRAIEQYVKDHKEWFKKDASIPTLPIVEGKVNKGGINSPPTTPRPGRPGAMGKGTANP